MRDVGNKCLGWAHFFVLVTGATSVALALTVLVGWYTGAVGLVQVLPTSTPMQSNTALALLLCGLGLLTHLDKRTYLATACGVAVSLIGLLTLGEYVLGVDLGIDGFLIEGYVTVKTTHPGRIAPDTVLMFLFSGLALVFLTRGFFDGRTGLVSGILGSLVIGQAAVAVICYLGGVEPTLEGGHFTHTHMAIHTAAGFALVGAGLLVAAWRKDATNKEVVPHWLPIPTGIAFATLTIEQLIPSNASHPRLCVIR